MLAFLLLLSCADYRVRFVEAMLAAPPGQRAIYICERDRLKATPELLASLGAADPQQLVLEPGDTETQATVTAIWASGESQRFELRRPDDWCVQTGWEREAKERAAKHREEQDELRRDYLETLEAFRVAGVVEGGEAPQDPLNHVRAAREALDEGEQRRSDEAEPADAAQRKRPHPVEVDAPSLGLGALDDPLHAPAGAPDAEGVEHLVLGAAPARGQQHERVLMLGPDGDQRPPRPGRLAVLVEEADLPPADVVDVDAALPAPALGALRLWKRQAEEDLRRAREKERQARVRCPNSKPCGASCISWSKTCHK